MNDRFLGNRWRNMRAANASVVIVACCVLRRLPLFIVRRPRTPLRVLCIIALDAVHRLRHARPLSRHTVRLLAALLDFAACANAVCDKKNFSRREHRLSLHRIAGDGVLGLAREYLRRLRRLEGARPVPGRAERCFCQVALYREAVVRLSLGTMAAAAQVCPRLEAGIRAIDRDADLNLLFRIAMQCQIIDDVLDYPRDLLAGLPSFLTAITSESRALELARFEALRYGEDRFMPRTGELFPLRCALLLVSMLTKLAIRARAWRMGHSARVMVPAIVPPCSRSAVSHQ